MLQTIIHLLQNNRIEEARVLCERESRINKKNLGCWLLLTDIYARSGDFHKAESSIRKAIKLKAGHAESHTKLAMLYHNQRKYSKAEACYRQSLKLNNKQPLAHFNLGAVLHELGNIDDALVEYKEAIDLKPDYGKAYANMGFILRYQGKTEQAIECYQKAIDLEPGIAEVHYNLGLSFLVTDRTEEAELHFLEAIRIKNNYALAIAGIGAVYMSRGNAVQAGLQYQRALKIEPDNEEIIRDYSKLLSSLGEHEKAIEQIDRILEFTPNDIELLLAKGLCEQLLGSNENAMACCEQVLKIDPGNESATILCASVYEKKGDPQKAYQYLSALLEKERPEAAVLLNYANISKSLGLTEDAIKRIEQLLENDQSISVNDLRKLHFSLGKAYDSQDEYDAAFGNFHKANELNDTKYDINILKSDVDSRIKIFTPGFETRLNKSSKDSIRPVFIVGMPRSGTTLVEQILSSHPQVVGGGELSDISNLVTSMQDTCGFQAPYPAWHEQVSTTQLDNMAQTYLDKLSKINDESCYVTDKMPANYMNLGTIQLLFPNAHIIHCIRDPLDTCLSCYIQDFLHGHLWTYNLEDCGKVYTEYRRMMQHWKEVLNISFMDVYYEELVQNQEDVSRQMINFLNLDWDDNCLTFHKNKRFAWTASYDQVRQPIYNRSVKRWEHYESHITPLIETLKTNGII